MNDFAINIANINELYDKKSNNSPEIIINISDDYYEAYLSIKEYNGKKLSIKKEDILKALEQKNIVYGIDYDAIEKILESPTAINKIVVARGKKHKNGKDGKIMLNFDPSYTIKPKLLSNGRVDHKNLSYVKQVNKGDILAQKVNPTQGENGITVTGKTIKAKPGKHINFITGKNVTISDDGMLLIANVTGNAKIIDGKISVVEVLEIDGNVGIATGNIVFNGKVIVKGNVQAGYIIKSEDDVEIYGIVEGAKIYSNESIIIHKGVHNKSNLYAEKDVKSSFVENSLIEAKGNIICDAIMHCNIKCCGKIFANEKKGLIVGGTLKVRKSITAKTIGSNIGTVTKIELGIDQEIIDNYKYTKEQIEALKKNIQKLHQAIQLLETKLSKKPSDIKFKLALKKTLSTKQEYIEKIKKLEEDLNLLHLTFEKLRDSKIHAELIYPGTKIKINNSYYNVRNFLKNVILMKENGEIRISYY